MSNEDPFNSFPKCDPKNLDDPEKTVSLKDKIENFYDKDFKDAKAVHDLAPSDMGLHEFQVKVVCYLSALGLGKKQIARKTGIPSTLVDRIHKSQSGKSEIDRVQKDLFLKDPQKWFDYILPNSIEVAFRLMMNKKTKDSTRAEIAFNFMDRALGKPKQTIEQNNNLIKDVIVQLDQATKMTEDRFISDVDIVNKEDEKPDTRDELDKAIEGL